MLLAAGLINFASAAETSHQKLTAVPFTEVSLDDDFWARRIETNRKVTIWYDFGKCEETGRINNFAKAGGLMEGEFEGIYFNDSDVFKVIEGAAYSLKTHYDARLDKYLDDLIAKIAAAQEDDGYLYTNRTINPAKAADGAGSKRWSKLRQFHELYNVGHMYEAAVAHYRATGKRTLLEVAIKNADLVDKVFGPGKKIDVPGHEEIEIGLVKLYQVTNEKRYLNLAKFFIDMRGRKDKRQIYGTYCQDHTPVIEQTKAVGHAVRAGYLYSGMADVAAHTGQKAYIAALDKIWDNVVSKKLYITGGIGSNPGGEAFGDDYELPNKSAYNETCAAIANALWNHRMFLLHGHARYIDVLERVMYNGFLSGISLTGNRFFYQNPLASDGNYQRSEWFGCSCCPVNVVRFIPSLSGYVYAYRNRDIYVNLYAAGSGTVKLPDNNIKLIQQTRYPWDGKVNISVDAYPSMSFPGSIVRVATKGTLSSNVVTFEVKVEVEGKDKHFLKPEMTANVKITAMEKEDVILLPVSALSRRKRETFATVNKSDGTQEERSIEPGVTDGEFVEVISGLSEGEEILLPDEGEEESRWRKNNRTRGNSARNERRKVRMIGRTLR